MARRLSMCQIAGSTYFNSRTRTNNTDDALCHSNYVCTVTINISIVLVIYMVSYWCSECTYLKGRETRYMCRRGDADPLNDPDYIVQYSTCIVHRRISIEESAQLFS